MDEPSMVPRSWYEGTVARGDTLETELALWARLERMLISGDDPIISREELHQLKLQALQEMADKHPHLGEWAAERRAELETVWEIRQRREG